MGARYAWVLGLLDATIGEKEANNHHTGDSTKQKKRLHTEKATAPNVCKNFEVNRELLYDGQG